MIRWIGRGWWSLLLAGVGLFLLFVLAAPSLLSWSGVRRPLLSQCVPSELGQVSIQQLRLGWFQTIQARQVDLRAADGNSWLTIESVTLDRTLWQLIRSPNQLGELTIDGPKVDLALRADGSNLEDFLQKLSSSYLSPPSDASSGSPPGSLPSLRVRVVNGEIHGHSSDSSTHPSDAADPFTLSSWNVVASLPTEAEPYLQLTSDGAFQKAPFSLQLKTPLPGTAGKGNGAISGTALPLAPLNYLMRRLGQPIQMEGTITCETKGTWDLPQSDVTTGKGNAFPPGALSGKLEAQAFRLTTPWLDDPLQFDRATIETDIQMEGNRLKLPSAQLTSEWGDIRLQGEIPTDVWNPQSGQVDYDRLLQLGQIESSGQLDLAVVTSRLPRTLRLREDTRLEAGRVSWTVMSQMNDVDPSRQADRDETRSTATGSRFKGELKTDPIRLRRGKDLLPGDFPLQIVFSVLDRGNSQSEKSSSVWNRWSIEQAKVTTDFARASAHGTLHSGELRGDADLAQLAQELGQLVDLGDLEFRGKVALASAWKIDEAQNLQGEANLTWSQVRMVHQNKVVFDEPELRTQLQFAGRWTGTTLAPLNHLVIGLQGPHEVAEMQLVAPVADISLTTPLQFECRCQGELLQWKRRMSPWQLLTDWDLRGGLTLESTISVSSRRLELSRVAGDVRNLLAMTEGMRISEPQIRFATQGTIDLQNLDSHFASLTLASQSLSAAGRNLAYRASPLQMGGELSYRADLARIHGIFSNSPNAQAAADPTPATRMSGLATGRVDLRTSADLTTFRLQSEVQQFKVEQLPVSMTKSNSVTRPVHLTAPATLWEEPKIQLSLTGDYDPRSQRIRWSSQAMEMSGIALQSAGSVDEIAAIPRIDLQGSLRYDWARIAPQLKPYLGSSIEVHGIHEQPIVLRGPLWEKGQMNGTPTKSDEGAAELSKVARVSEELTGSFGLAWERANAYQLPLGHLEGKGELQQGVLRWAPIPLVVGNGKLHLAPTIYVNTPPIWMTLPAGPLAERLLLTPELCKSWMRFVAPLLADSTTAEGEFSINLVRTEIPLLQPMMGTVQGELDVHGAQVGPGPLAVQFLELAQQIKQLAGRGDSRIARTDESWLQLQPQRIPFQLQGGRVYHEGFQIQIDDVIVRTRGSVGLDETMDMVAEIPIQDDWIKDRPVLAGLQGTSLSIPIGGTVSRPRLDQRALTQLSSQMVRQAAEGYLQQEIGNQLEKQLKKLFK